MMFCCQIQSYQLEYRASVLVFDAIHLKSCFFFLLPRLVAYLKVQQPTRDVLTIKNE